MKRMLKTLFFLLFTLNISFVFAWTIDHFVVEFPEDSALSLESIDLTIKAVDKNNDVVTDYTWNIIGISQTDDLIELPEDLANDNWYSFKLSDQWIKKFENWITFSSAWEHSLSIYDINDYENLIGKWEITIIESSGKNTEIEIEILTPETNTTLPSNDIKISWATKKNHQVRIELNNSETFTTTSNTDWIFEKEIKWLQDWENIFKAYILDSSENIIWESKEVIIKIDSNIPTFKKIILSPLSDSWSVEEWTNIDVKVFANKWLKTVKLLFNDWVVPLSETEDWIYTWNFKAPNEEKEFLIDVVLADYLWHIVTKKDVTSIKVTLVLSSPEIEPVKPVEITCSWSNIKTEELKIDWLKLVKLKNKSILTWDKVDIAESYDIYKKNENSEFDFIKNVKIPKFEIEITWEQIKHQYFAVKAKAEWCNEGSSDMVTIDWDLSEATKIQTWPTEILLMLLLSLILGFGFVLIKRKEI